MANFINLDSVEKLNQVIESSNQNPVILFKHSTTCPISMGVYQEMSKYQGDVNLVIVQNSRDVSTKIADLTKIRHESPQAIVVKNGEPVFHASHYDITAGELASAVE